MYWHISKLILTTWRNRLRQLFSRSPALWGLILVLLIIYGVGSYQLYFATYHFFQIFSKVVSLVTRFKPAVYYAFVSLFGISSFMLMVVSIQLSPSETVLRRVLTPFPIPLHQQRIGVLLPGLLFLCSGQLILWIPIMLSFIQAGMAKPLALLCTTIAGLMCYSVIALVFFQFVLYLITRLFGTERVGLQRVAVGLSLMLGLVGLVVSLYLGQTSLLTGRPIWLWFMPSFWMTLMLTGNGRELIIGAAILLFTTFVGIGLYIKLVKHYELLLSGTKGLWVPFKNISFGKHVLTASTVYELKTMHRDQELVTSLGIIIGIGVAAVCTIVWLRLTHSIWRDMVTSVTISFFTFLLCTLAQFSWGRDHQTRRILRSMPLNSHTFVNGKLLSNVWITIVYWIIVGGSIALVSGNVSSLLTQVPLFLLGIFLAFWLGIVFPRSPDSPFSSILFTGVVLIFGVPLMMLVQEVLKFIDHLPLNTISITASKGGLYVLTLAVCYGGILWLDYMKEVKDRD